VTAGRGDDTAAPAREFSEKQIDPLQSREILAGDTRGQAGQRSRSNEKESAEEKSCTKEHQKGTGEEIRREGQALVAAPFSFRKFNSTTAGHGKTRPAEVIPFI